MMHTPFVPNIMRRVYYFSVYINQLQENTIVVGATADEFSLRKNLEHVFGPALESLGVQTSRLRKKMYRGSLAFVAMKGKPERTTTKAQPRRFGPCYLAHTLAYGESASMYSFSVFTCI